MKGQRARNPRRVLVDQLRNVKDQVNLMLVTWAPAQITRIYVPRAQRSHAAEVFRARGLHEYPERQANEWALVYWQVEEMITTLEQVKATALTHCQDLGGEQS